MVKVSVPSLPAGQTGVIAAIDVKEGQFVQAGQRVAVLRRGDQALEIHAQAAGFVVGLHAEPGQLTRAEQALCYLAEAPTLILADQQEMIVYGAGGHGKSVIELAQATGRYRVVGVIDDAYAEGGQVLGIPILGGSRALAGCRARGVALAANGVGGIGAPDTRARVFESLLEAGFTCPALVHPTAWVEPSAVVEEGAQVFAHAYVGSETRVGFGSVLNTGSIASHDCRLGRVVNVSPGGLLAGQVRVEDLAQIGMAATVNLNLTIGARARVGNGATVKADVPAGGRVRAGAIWPPMPVVTKP